MQVTWKEIKEDSIINVCQLINCWEPSWYRKHYSGWNKSKETFWRILFWPTQSVIFKSECWTMVEHRNKWVATEGIEYDNYSEHQCTLIPFHVQSQKTLVIFFNSKKTYNYFPSTIRTELTWDRVDLRPSWLGTELTWDRVDWDRVDS